VESRARLHVACDEPPASVRGRRYFVSEKSSASVGRHCVGSEESPAIGRHYVCSNVPPANVGGQQYLGYDIPLMSVSRHCVADESSVSIGRLQIMRESARKIGKELVVAIERRTIFESVVVVELRDQTVVSVMFSFQFGVVAISLLHNIFA